MNSERRPVFLCLTEIRNLGNFDAPVYVFNCASNLGKKNHDEAKENELTPEKKSKIDK